MLLLLAALAGCRSRAALDPEPRPHSANASGSRRPGEGGASGSLAAGDGGEAGADFSLGQGGGDNQASASAGGLTGGTLSRSRSNGGQSGRRSDGPATGGDVAATTGGEDLPATGGGGAAPAYSVKSCGALSASDECEVTGSGAALVLRGDVLTPGVVYEGGGVRLEGGVIGCLGCACDLSDATVVTCPGAVIAPGLVNAHDHLAYDGQGPRPLGTERYDHRHDWRLGLRGHTALSYAGGASAVERAAQELRMLLGGVTTIAGGAGQRGLVRNADMPDLGEGLPTAAADSETFPLDDANGLLLANGCAYGKDHATADDVARAGAFVAHLGEGVDGAAENELTCASTDAFGLFGPTSGAVHAIATTAPIAAELAARSTVVVWSPRSNVALYGNTAPVPLLVRSGVEVALGTDWLLTGSMNLLRELDCARKWSSVYFDHALDDHALFSMVTSAGARAVGAADALGRLAPGMLADAVVVTRRGREPFETLVTAEPADFLLLTRGGVPLYGRAPVLEALGGGDCAALDVCGAAQRVCTGDSGFSLAELEAAADAVYPLFTCEAPPDEPTCVPARPGEYDGTPTELDHDGDGVPDTDDRCPTVFDPPRPLDAGAQADTDGDGRGDACDACPLDARDTCARRSDDRDADGVPDGTDRCPDASDREQSDADGDGRGDACDYCTTANPGISPCPLSIAAVRDHGSPEHPPRHARVEIASAVVTALRPNSGTSRGFYVQDGDGPYSGLFVYTASDPPGVEVGDRVTLRGLYDVYHDTDELVDATVVTRESLAVTPEPLVVTAEDVGDDGALGAQYESMLVTVPNAVVVETNPDAPSDYDETLLTGALRLDDLLDPELDNGFAPDSVFPAVTGILGYSFGHRKLMPRGPADLGE